jgi:hypothetical protein
MGHIPRAHQPERTSLMPRVEWYKQGFHEARRSAQEAMKRAQGLWQKKEKNFKPYQENDQVWLEAKNLKTTHPTTKLRPLRYGPFKVLQAISPVTYKLEILAQWQIHNAFYATV